jgi:glucan phosphoethanolaminetransferase (alkaline phosphatase superfamily)
MILWEHFDKNEIYILVMLVVAYSAFFFFPKKLPVKITLLFLVWGFASSTLFDFTIGGGLLDFYKVNDSNHYELSDLLTYFLFATFGYFFVYFYERLHINKQRFIFYVLGWTIVGLIMERVSSWMGVTHYQHGYKLPYSVAVFLVVQTTTGLYYEFIKNKENIPVSR